MKPDVKKSLTAIVGPDNFSDQLIDLVSYSSDATSHRHRPEAAVWVTDADQVADVLAFCNRERIPVTARGAGTSLAGLSVPVRGGLVMDLCRMNRIIDIDARNQIAVIDIDKLPRLNLPQITLIIKRYSPRSLILRVIRQPYHRAVLQKPGFTTP